MQRYGPLPRSQYLGQRSFAEEYMNTLEQRIAFMHEIEGLKSVLRTSWTSAGRHESTAEHSWRLALLTVLLLDDFPELDARDVMIMALIHDLGELYDGDISAALMPDEDAKLALERAAVERAFSLLPETDRTLFMRLWSEYSTAATPEARFVKALDKAETIFQHNRGRNPEGFNYSFNLEYGKQYFQDSPLMQKLRFMLDAETRRRIQEKEGKE